MHMAATMAVAAGDCEHIFDLMAVLPLIVGDADRPFGALTGRSAKDLRQQLSQRALLLLLLLLDTRYEPLHRR